MWNGFLKSILDAPDDDGPRLIYADWLDDLGDYSRAEFIRVQIALSRLAPHDRRRNELQRTETKLLARHQDEWTLPFRGLASGFHFRRGFVESAKLTARQFLANAADLFHLTPLGDVHVLDVGSHLQSLLFSPWLQRLHGLSIYAQHLGESLARTISESPHFHGLRRLNIARNEIANGGLSCLAFWPILSTLEELEIGENGITESGVRTLIHGVRLDQLRRLDLSGNSVGMMGAELLAGSDRLPRLTRLGLSANQLGSTPRWAPNPSTLLRMSVLDLSENQLNAEALRGILNHSGPNWIAELDLSGNELGDTGAAIIARSECLTNLHTLRLTNNQIGDAGLVALAESPVLGRLATLEVGNNPVGNVGVRAVIESRRLSSLRNFLCPVLGLTINTRLALHTRYPGFH